MVFIALSSVCQIVFSESSPTHKMKHLSTCTRCKHLDERADRECNWVINQQWSLPSRISLAAITVRQVSTRPSRNAHSLSTICPAGRRQAPPHIVLDVLKGATGAPTDWVPGQSRGYRPRQVYS